MLNSLHSLTATVVMVVLLGGSGIAGYAQDILLGMKIEKVAQTAEPTVICAKNASRIERLAAKEVRRYLYLRSGRMPRIVADLPKEAAGELIVVGTKSQTVIEPLLSDAQVKATVGGLSSEQYMLKTIPYNGRPMLLIVGGDDSGTLYGAYRFAEHLGVRFYLHGDVVPDEHVAFAMPILDEMRKPLFDRRGILPFHDFPEGPDWWSRDGYKAVLSQLPKLGMNFFGLHTYPESPMWSHVGPEPLVWIGPPDELAADGTVKASYPSRHFTASNVNGAWGYRPGTTRDYVLGAADLFDRDDYGADYMRDTCPWNKMPAEQCNALFDRMGEFLGDVFTFARGRGIKTCLGTETPLIVPTRLKERLQAAGKNPADPAVVQELYEGMFRRIVKIHPLDYYWLWTPENWTMTSVNQEQVDATVVDFRAVLAAVEKTRPPFTLATCGWVLGPPQSPSLFDEFLPKEMPMSCISRGVGYTPVEPGFAKVNGRPKWAIPWLEDDMALTTPQLWAGRMRRDAFDALQYGCTGLMGIHWRTRILAPNVAALAQAAWDQHGWSGGAARIAAPEGDGRYLPIADFYADWARTEFGPEAADSIAAIFTRLDGRLPRPAEWPTSITAGPGGIKPDERPWEQVQKEYGFVDELAAIRPIIAGPGNLDRFDYWLNSLQHLRSVARVRCVWARFNGALDAVKGEKDPQSQKQLAREQALPLRKELVAAFAELHRHLLATVTNSGELGSVCNWQQQTLPALLTAPGQELAGLMGEELPADAMPSKQYVGESRLFVLDTRPDIAAGEPLRLKVILLGPPPHDAAIHWRPLGPGPYSTISLNHVARGVYTAPFPAEATKTDFEYYVQATVGDQPLVFPKTAPQCNHTVVVDE